MLLLVLGAANIVEARPKVCLLLSGGGARGAAHILIGEATRRDVRERLAQLAVTAEDFAICHQRRTGAMPAPLEPGCRIRFRPCGASTRSISRSRRFISVTGGRRTEAAADTCFSGDPSRQ